MKRIKVVELFAGVGGFRIGLNNASSKDVKYETVWNSQWEPGSSVQHASMIYQTRFTSKGHSCEDIEKVVSEKFDEIPQHDLLVGGFPCQDYSVARTLNHAKGLEGRKGVLWWSIYNILKKSGDKAPNYLMLENVDRLLKSPASQRGRDFAVMLASLNELDYALEWRVINAAEYGFPQRRRRVYMLGYKKGSKPYKKLMKVADAKKWLLTEGVIAHAFPVSADTGGISEFSIEGGLANISEHFSSQHPKVSPFHNAGLMVDGKVTTVKVAADYSGKYTLLKDVLVDDKLVDESFYINSEDLKRWQAMKGAKSEERTTKDGHTYHYSEGSMVFPDSLDKPSRTIVTGEGGSTPSRFKHVIKTKSGRLRRLTPLELERLNMFPDNHTEGVSDTKRAFIMGNALVVGVIEGLGRSLANMIK